MAEGTIAESFVLEEESRGMIGPFCLETIVTDKLEFKVFEISARIVAGSNPFIGGSPYSDINEERMSTGRRIARSIKKARDDDRLTDISVLINCLGRRQTQPQLLVQCCRYCYRTVYPFLLGWRQFLTAVLQLLERQIEQLI